LTGYDRLEITKIRIRCSEMMYLHNSGEIIPTGLGVKSENR